MSNDEEPQELKLFSPNNHSQHRIRWKDCPDSEEQVRKVLSTHYPVAAVKEIHQVDEWERQSNNFRVRLRLKKWDADLIVLLRKNIKWNREVDIRDVDRIIRYLDERGLPVPRILPTEDGESLVYDSGHFWQIYEFIYGNHYRGDSNELKDIARRIAAMHKLLQEAPFVEEVKSKTPPRKEWRRSAWMEILGKTGKRETWVDLLLSDNREMIIATMDSVEPQLEAMASSPKQIIHRDLHPWNTICGDNSLRAILDFSDAHFGELLRDVACACHRFVRQFVVYQSVRRSTSIRELVNEGVSKFLIDYDWVNPLRRDDRFLISAFMQDELLTKTLSNVSRYYQNGDDSQVTDGELLKKLNLLMEASIIGGIAGQI